MTLAAPKTARLEAGPVADLLEEIGRRVTLHGGNRYRGRAYLQAADRLRALTMPLDRVVADGALQQIPGIGQAIARAITDLHKTGTHSVLEELRSDIPPGVLEMLRIPGLRPERVLALFREHGIASLPALEEAARTGRLAALPRFGAAVQRKVLQGIETLNTGAGRRHITRAADLLADAEKALRQTMPELGDIMIAGDLRRGCELVADLALVAVAKGKPRTLEAAGIAIRVTNASRRGAALMTATGSARHLDQLREVAAQKGYVLNENGLRRGRRIIAASEEAIYAALGRSFRRNCARAMMRSPWRAGESCPNW
jgi:DNA polymerase (family 10)